MTNDKLYTVREVAQALDVSPSPRYTGGSTWASSRPTAFTRPFAFPRGCWSNCSRKPVLGTVESKVALPKKNHRPSLCKRQRPTCDSRAKTYSFLKGKQCIVVSDSQSPQQPSKPMPPAVKVDAIPGRVESNEAVGDMALSNTAPTPTELANGRRCIDARTFGNARSNDPDTWVLFDAAFTAHADTTNNLDGVGFMLGDGWAGIDIDNCLDADQHFIIDAAPEVIKNLDTYTEVSPSGRGVKMLFQANTGKGRKFGGLECYSQGRFFTITGHHLPATPATPQARQQRAEEFLATYFEDDPEPVVVDHAKFSPSPSPMNA